MKDYDNTLGLKIRLQLAYHDILRTKVPFITKRYIKNFHKSQLAAARRLKGKETLKVVFFATTPGMWKADSVFRAMQANEKYHPIVVIGPYSTFKGFSREEVESTVERTRLFIEAKGYEYVIPYDKTTGRWQDIKQTLNPDIVFFDSPYKDHPPYYFIYHFRDRLTCYVSYGFLAFSYLYKTNYDLLFHNLVGCFFHESTLHKQLAAENSRCHAINGLVTGYPATEIFLDKSYIPNDVWKPQPHKKKRVIWAPHQSIEEKDTLAMSTFLIYYEYMLALAEKYSDTIQFAFKPHQLLKFKLLKIWGETKTESYYRRWNELSNTQLEESSYTDLFLTSDAIIHDSASFTTEYLFTKKPAMFLVREERVEHNFSPFGKIMFDAYYHGYEKQDIDHFLSAVVLGGDDPKASDRRDVFEKYLQPIDGILPSQKILQVIEKVINGDTSTFDA